MTTGHNLSIDDAADPFHGRVLSADHCDGCEHAAGWTTLDHAARRGLNASQTAELLDMLGINPKILKDTR